MYRLTYLLLLSFFISAPVIAQDQKKDEGKFIKYENEFWNKIKESVKEYNKDEEPEKKSFILDFSNYNIPESKEEFQYQWHFPPISQGWTGTCWCFSTTSFFETEIERIHDKKIDISELYTVYWEYVEKARRFVRERGKSKFAEGSEANAVPRMWKKYGCMPAEAYTGLKEGQEFHYHGDMYKEMRSYLKNVKETNAWNEQIVLSTIKDIMNHYIGAPPTVFDYGDGRYTPKEFLDKVVRINPDDYVDIMSLKQPGYWKQALYDVPDNWWKDSSYYNVPLDVFMETLENSVKKGYSMFIGGDVSESGYYSYKEAAVVPSYDIPSAYIDEIARQFRFSNKTTTDDHGIHLVGFKEQGDDIWYLIKDSGSGSRNAKNKGYYFYHEDYIKLKIMNFMIHKDAVEDILNKF